MFLLLLCLHCASPEQRLPRATGGWHIDRLRYEYVLEEDVINERDSADFGQLIFEENGGGQFVPTAGDSTQLQAIDWQQLTETRVRLSFERLRFEGFGTFDFRILENERNQQLWRAEALDRVYNPLRADSSQVRLLLQLELSRR